MILDFRKDDTVDALLDGDGNYIPDYVQVADTETGECLVVVRDELNLVPVINRWTCEVERVVRFFKPPLMPVNHRKEPYRPLDVYDRSISSYEPVMTLYTKEDSNETR